jgi:hypothetical protein
VLGPWRFEWTRQNGQPSIFDAPRHLWVGHVLVDQHASDELRVSERTADFAIDLDQIERNVTPFKIGYSQNGIDSDLCKLLIFLRDAERLSEKA